MDGSISIGVSDKYEDYSFECDKGRAISETLWV